MKTGRGTYPASGPNGGWSGDTAYAGFLSTTNHRTAREDPDQRGDDSNKQPVGAGFKPAPTNQTTNTHHSPSFQIPPIPVQNPAHTTKTCKSPAGHTNTPDDAPNPNNRSLPLQIKAHQSNHKNHSSDNTPQIKAHHSIPPIPVQNPAHTTKTCKSPAGHTNTPRRRTKP